MSRKYKKTTFHPERFPKMISPQPTNDRQLVVKGVVCEFDGRRPPTTWPIVSLCMIVKNEERHLAACLESVGDFASEIIIVDTGSTDRTIEIAESFGARVNYFSWVDDFAAARNESIKEATGEWIIWMDADDRLTPVEVARLKQAVVSNQADVYMCRVVSQDQQGSSEANVEHLRLFRSHRGLHFEFPLHETIMGIAIKKGLKIARTNIVVEHTGYQISPEGYRIKARRNLTIINRCLEQEPDSLFWHFHRAAALSLLEENEQAIADYEAVIANPPPDLHWDINIYQAHTGLLNIYHNLGRSNEARRVLALALERFPQRRHLAILAGHFYLLQDELDEALASLQRAKNLPPYSDFLGQAWPPGRLEWVLGQVYLLAGNLFQAGVTYRAMLAQMGGQVELATSAELVQAQTLFEAKDYAAVFDLLDPIAPGNPGVLRLLAQAEHHRQNGRNAAACLAQAIALSGPQPGEWVTLAELLIRTRRFASAERLCHLVIAEDSQNADAYHWLGFIAMQRNEADQALIYFVRARLADPTHTGAQENLAQLAAALELPTAEVIRQHGLHMIKQCHYTGAVEALSLLLAEQPADAEAYKSLAVALNGLGRQDEAFLAWQAAQQLAAVVTPTVIA